MRFSLRKERFTSASDQLTNWAARCTEEGFSLFGGGLSQSIMLIYSTLEVRVLLKDPDEDFQKNACM